MKNKNRESKYIHSTEALFEERIEQDSDSKKT